MLAAMVAMLVMAAADEPTRTDPRLHWELSLAGSLPPAVGAHGEVGVVLGDQHVFALRVDGGTHLVGATFQVGLSWAEWVTDWLTLGIGGTFAAIVRYGDQPGSFGGQLPIRASFLLFLRQEWERERRGLTIGVEFSPGFWARRPYALDGPELGWNVMGALSLGWATW